MPKFFYQPVSPFIVTQYFGENSACVDLATGTKVITCDGTRPPKGYKSLYGAAGHKGVDVRAKHGQPVYCSGDGYVEAIDTNPRTGLDVKVVSIIGARKIMHVYEHLLGYQPKVGQRLKVGDLIGWADNTGWSAGDHLHLEFKEWKAGKWVSIDPIPLMEPLYALKYAGLWRQIQELTAKVAELVADKMRK